jgi:hypothetical protein
LLLLLLPGPTTAAVLRAKGVLVYSEEVASTVDADVELPAGGWVDGWWW